ncbi:MULTISPECIES: exodeoxyribonuclease VII large subunit [Mammaliicoccus]|jgi:exodeoxyribonuclease VII large subunit|uniref:Exodeoxyribonuclease 7 large subunit n=1 Tax=Mammaliicoccus sciuri TaxID=1296 RepID=A0AAW5LFD5_MAMSC|nr:MULTISPECIES: exodeoxyribonuclease VII large subunit [Mammaliicoccus]KTT83470.1 exodeoxyribonuclease VII large subunit [Mammaliicoccus sciuri]MBA1396577.1 exodeoxyribonuclease VII large subunit [Mammaliicoccus sciuri]MBF0719395.1 exodeoxyribonuclease VII large subunit [Mammaliicoccus sciuri]MBF0774467.1 exodeoxyribonuclease VII large subunit [Mammaliicoccus sciuri]MBG9205081.1 exodeoxyribonuclease VII large subunit [Mammaliicoccus sciuri]
MDKYLSVTAITKYIKYKFDQDPHLLNVFIKGEISNFKRHSSGHLYFALKDDKGVLSAMMFKSSANQLSFNPKEGDQVLVEGRIGVYESRGAYQIYVQSMQLDGVGLLYEKFEALKKELAEKGYFDQEHKLSIPKYPKKIAVLTASTGAAIRDICSTLDKRYPLAEQVLMSTLVQGKGAKDNIINNIKEADSMGVDVIIVGRGGGSIEDLWSFNEREVVEAIYHCKTPVISAVGHETDTTLSDFVSDVRAATPTQAAVIATPDINALYQLISNARQYLTKHITQTIQQDKHKLKQLSSYYKLKTPSLLYDQETQKLDELQKQLSRNLEQTVTRNNHKLDILQNKLRITTIYNKTFQFRQDFNRLNMLQTQLVNRIISQKKQVLTSKLAQLDALSPTQIMLRGYSIIEKNDKIITSKNDLKIDDDITINLKDGKINANVKEIR